MISYKTPFSSIKSHRLPFLIMSIVFLCNFTIGQIRVDTIQSVNSSSDKKDTLQTIKASKAIPDTLQISTPDSVISTDTSIVVIYPRLGNHLSSSDTASYTHKMMFIWSDYRYAREFLGHLPGFFLRELGEVGQPNQLISLGWRGTVYQLDGRSLNDPLT